MRNLEPDGKTAVEFKKEQESAAEAAAKRDERKEGPVPWCLYTPKELEELEEEDRVEAVDEEKHHDEFKAAIRSAASDDSHQTSNARAVSRQAKNSLHIKYARTYLICIHITEAELL